LYRPRVEHDAPAFGRPGTVLRYGHWGRPVLVFPSEAGRAWDYENNGMVGAVAHLIDDGRVKLYCVDSFDGVSWADRALPIEERARHHQAYQSWITDQVAAYVGSDSPGATEAVVTGCSMGAYHALQMAL
jgi:esterase/lipase superfamily enzyme